MGEQRRGAAIAMSGDGGSDFMSLRGVELRGRAVLVGEVPRRGDDVDELTEPERIFAAKYAGGRGFSYDGRHAWCKLEPTKIVSWDFSKMRK
ncbi:hypothetical protein [Rhodococcus artemisiae]|uniref:Uncharacterized protein n=1 Tax=Rhodococcus artemisiae TaxID=714159 RepID=A0ABU7L5V6_9NOCA|nr:hypothetical protein [Rhodococcus artemisiae]MEE2056921.1 hypothetical protein [Rhodococcus artemisiae]